jgi:hypothetical protein
VYRVYIDEAGDRGHHPDSSEYFVLSAIIVKDSDDAAVRAQLGAFRAALGRHPGHVVHFRKLSHSQKIKACQDIATMPIAAIANVIICKCHVASALPTGEFAYIKQADPMYLYAIRLLLERISWYVDEHGGGPAIATFAHLTRFKASKLHDYRAALASSPTEIRWTAYAGHPFRFDHPNTIELLQVADATASALFKAVEPDAWGNREDRYLHALRDLLYRRGVTNVTSYGLKVFPPAYANAGSPLEFLRSF